MNTDEGVVTIIRKDGEFRCIGDTTELPKFLELLTDDYFIVYQEYSDREKVYFAESGRWWAGALEVMEEIEKPAIDLPGERFIAYIRLTRWNKVHLSPERQEKLEQVKSLVAPAKAPSPKTEKAG